MWAQTGGGRPSEEIQVARLDDFCTDHDIRHIDLLRLDVEGSELRVLEGTRSLLSAGAIDLIQFEFGRASIDARTFMKDIFRLLEARYTMNRVVADSFFPIHAYSERFEVFLTTNYLAIRREGTA